MRRATKLNPGEALYWSDLASACEPIGDATCAKTAINHALDLSPLTPRMWWAAANYDLRSGHRQEAFERFRRLLDLDASYAAPTFEACLRTLGEPGLVAEELRAGNRTQEVRLDLASFLSSAGDDDSAYAVWRQFASHNVPASMPTAPGSTSASVASYLDRLIDRGREIEALGVWADLERLHFLKGPGGRPLEPAPGRQDNLVFNGSFEDPPLNWGFDWRYQPEPFVPLAFTTVAAHSGARSLRLAFTVPANEDFEPLYEVVPVHSNQSYVLSAFVRSESITSNSGPRLRVTDPACPGCMNATTEDAVATTPWHRVQVSFFTSSQTRFVKVSVWRPRSRSYPTTITGDFWLDDVSLSNGVSQDLARSDSRAAQLSLGGSTR